MNRDAALSAAGLIVLGLVVLLALHQWEDRDRITDAEERPETPALILDGVAAESFSDSGLLRYRLRSQQAMHFDGDSRTEVTSPLLELRDPELLWEITAQRGHVEDNNARVRLVESVHARHHREDLEVETSEVHYRPADEILWMPSAVVIRHPLGTIRAGSLEANLVTGYLELRQSVESRYVPPSS